MLDAPLLLPPLLLALLLVVSGVAKLRHPEETRSAFAQLRMPAALTDSPAPALLPWGEIVLALALLLAPPPVAIVVAGLATLLVLTYLAVIVRALGFGYPVTCSCFGRLGLGEVTRRTAVRNVLLVVVALLGVWSATADESVAARLLGASATTWVWLALVALTVAVVVVTFGGTKGEPVASPEETFNDEPADYGRQPLPFAALEDETGRSRPLTDLISQGAVLLVFVSPGCGPCRDVIRDIPEWDESLGPVALRAVVTQPIETALTSAPGLTGRILHDPAGTLMRIFAVGTPGAVLLGGDGLLAGGPVRGQKAVAQFVADVRAELLEAGVVEDIPGTSTVAGEVVSPDR